MGIWKKGIALLFLGMIATPVYAQEKVADGYAVKLGILSWEQIRRGTAEKPATHAEEYHVKMAREMAKMHGGGGKGTYHILVVIDDKKTGKRVDKADVRVKVIDRLRRQKEETVRLQPMTMDGSSGFGEFVRITYGGTYVIRVLFRLSGKEAFQETEFVKEFTE